MKLTHAKVQGPNSRPPPRTANQVAIPIGQLWNQGLDAQTRGQLLEILSRATARQPEQLMSTLPTPPLDKEVSGE